VGFLNSKERIFDVVLTDAGRKALSQNLLNFEFFAFSDEGVDYAAALTASLLPSGSVDDYVRRTLMFEAPQFKDYNEHRDMKTFLYSVPSRRRTLPRFITNFDDNPEITLKRTYFVDKLVLSTTQQQQSVKQPIAVVLKSTVEKRTFNAQMTDYVLQQQVAVTQKRLSQGLNVTGLPIAKDHIMMGPSKVLNIKTGFVKPLSAWAQDNQSVPSLNTLSISDEIDVVTGLSRVVIDLSLKSSEGPVVASSGYLVEVYESGSDGKITKLYEEDVVDVLEDTVLRKGFEADLFMDVDVTNAELISESQRIARREVRHQELALRRLQKNLRKQLRAGLAPTANPAGSTAPASDHFANADSESGES